MLERRVVDLGMGPRRVRRPLPLVDELADLLAATDVFVTPYRGREQIASGALTFAIAAGCATVSTPYWYAEDMLGSGAGTLVPFDDAGRSEAVCDFLETGALAAARGEARRMGADLAWPSVAEETAAVCRGTEAAPRRTPIPDVELELAASRTDHLLTLVDDCGIVQHALGAIPNRGSGTASTTSPGCCRRARAGGRTTTGWTPILHRSLAFLRRRRPRGHAGMRNFMGYDRRWLDEPHLGDHVGRAVWALGDILSTAWMPGVPGRRGPCWRAVRRSSPSFCEDGRLRRPRPRPPRSRSPRPGAAALLDRFVEQLEVGLPRPPGVDGSGSTTALRTTTRGSRRP